MADLAACDMILSIVPPAQAEGTGRERFLPLLRVRDSKPLFVDANALNPASKKKLAARLAEAGCDMVDGAIIGPPPDKASRVTTTFLSGPRAGDAAFLDVPGCGARVLEGDVGAASALKMCYGGINKGVVGLASALLRAAHRHGAADALRAEMQRSMPDLFARYGRQIPGHGAQGLSLGRGNGGDRRFPGRGRHIGRAAVRRHGRNIRSCRRRPGGGRP